MDDLLLSSNINGDSSVPGDADSSATGNTQNDSDIVIILNDIKELINDHFTVSDDETTEVLEYNTDDIYSLLVDIKSLNSSILIILIVTITISVFRKLFDQF